MNEYMRNNRVFASITDFREKIMDFFEVECLMLTLIKNKDCG